MPFISLAQMLFNWLIVSIFTDCQLKGDSLSHHSWCSDLSVGVLSVSALLSLLVFMTLLQLKMDIFYYHSFLSYYVCLFIVNVFRYISFVIT